jgi:hypothetical protein
MPDRPALTTQAVRSLATSLVTDELVVMPVRHHSPACAWQVRRAIAEHRPSVVLVEGPRSLTPLVPLLTHAEARMPLAVYTYAVRSRRGAPDERSAAYYPFCDYSPELVALRDAAAAGIPARFIDLDFAEQCLVGADPGDGQPEDGEGSGGARAGAAADPRAGQSLLDERHFEHSRRLQALAERLGCRDQEDLWERLFEADLTTTGAEEHLARVTAYCQVARRDHTAAELAADGTTAREAEMVWHIREALAARSPDAGPVLVVVGGFHAVALPGLLADPPARPAVRLTRVTTESAIIRYTFDRLERLNGYASGMTSPAWHQGLWRLVTEAGAPDARRTATLTALMDITDELRRRHRMPVAMPTVAAAYEQALRLADLRGRPAPLRSDLLDAITSCFVKGDVDVEGVLVRAAAHVVLTGSAVGTVPPGAGTPPLVNDALERLRAQRLRIDGAERQTAALDIYRRPAHRATSRLLHGLVLLGVPFATKVAGPDFVRGLGLGRLQERWEYLWTPATEGALVEASIHGTTVPLAVAARFEDRLAAYRESGDRRSARDATALLAQACVLGLHEYVGRTLEIVREAIRADAAFDGMAAATAQLGLLWESREPLEARGLGTLPGVVRTTYERTVFLGRELQGQECEPSAAVAALVQLRELLTSAAGADLDAELYWHMVTRLHSAHDVPMVRGGAAGLAYSSGRIDSTGLSRAVAGHLAGTTSAADSVGFLRGLLQTAREAAWQERELLASLDARLAAWDAEEFTAHLPELRLAFAGMTPMETDRIAKAVAALHGVGELGPLLLRDTDEASVQRHLGVSRAVAALLERDGLGSWVHTA